jgi:hypothetical protein
MAHALEAYTGAMEGFLAGSVHDGEFCDRIGDLFNLDKEVEFHKVYGKEIGEVLDRLQADVDVYDPSQREQQFISRSELKDSVAECLKRIQVALARRERRKVGRWLRFWIAVKYGRHKGR